VAGEDRHVMKIQSGIRCKLARQERRHRERRAGALRWSREIERVAQRQAALRFEFKEVGGGNAAVRGAELMDKLLERSRPPDVPDVARAPRRPSIFTIN